MLRTPFNALRAQVSRHHYFGTLVLATLAMLLVSVGRWHMYVTHRPVVLPDLGKGGTVVVYQKRDCPEARRAAERFLDLAGVRGISASAIMIPQGWRKGEEIILRRSLQLAILRSGLEATPVVLLVDGRGTVRFTYPIRVGVSQAELEEAAEALNNLLHLLSGNEEAEEERNPFLGMEA
jgi:hypothetical protein